MAKEKNQNPLKIVGLIASILFASFTVMYAQIKATEAARTAQEALRQSDLAKGAKARTQHFSVQAQKVLTEARAAEVEAQKIQMLLEQCQN